MINKIAFFLILWISFSNLPDNTIDTLQGTLFVGQSLVLKGDGDRWDRAVLCVNDDSLELSVEKNGQSKVMWTAGKISAGSWDKREIYNLEMMPDGRLNLIIGWENNRQVYYPIKSYPEYPVEPVPGSYLALEESELQDVRIALYAPTQELLWASDTSFRAPHVLYPSYSMYPPGVILTLEGDGEGFDRATMEFDGNSLLLFEHYEDTKELVWNSHPQTCGLSACKGKLGLSNQGKLYTKACYTGTFFQGDPSSVLFIDKDPQGKARLAMYSNERGVYWTSEMDGMNEDNMRDHWD